MSESFATLRDVIDLWRALTPEETQRAEKLLPLVSDSLRQEALNVGRNLDTMLQEGRVLLAVVKSVVVDVVARTIMTPTSGAPMTQMSQSALGYSVSGTFLVPGGGLFIKRSELARLGLLRQRVEVIELYDRNNRDAAE